MAKYKKGQTNKQNKQPGRTKPRIKPTPQKKPINIPQARKPNKISSVLKKLGTGFLALIAVGGQFYTYALTFRYKKPLYYNQGIHFTILL